MLESTRFNRRAFLGLAASAAAGAGVLLLDRSSPTCAAPIAEAAATQGEKHNVWVWRFDVDGPPDRIRDELAAHGLGIILKTHQGDNWMERFDKSPTSIVNAAKVREMADYFESAGVPFHAWCVVKGTNPVVEAQIASDVLNAGARSLTFDLEPSDGGYYWEGTNASALRLGEELRKLQPNAILTVAPDARPWQITGVPTAEFATFCNEVMPQSYWETFNGSTTRRMLAERGFHAGPEGVTPELILDATAATLAPFGLPVKPIGQGAASLAGWQRFINHAHAIGMPSVSVWRYGTVEGHVLPTMSAMPPPQPVAAFVPAAPIEVIAPPPAEAPALEAAQPVDANVTPSQEAQIPAVSTPEPSLPEGAAASCDPA